MSSPNRNFQIGRATFRRAVTVIPEIESELDRVSLYRGMAEGFHPANPVILSLRSCLIAILSCYALCLACAADAAQPDPDIARFISAKSNQVYLASRDSNTPVPPEVWQLFAAAFAADWQVASNLFEQVLANQRSNASHRLAPEVWGRVQEVGGFSSMIPSYNLKFIRLFAEEVDKVVPPGGIFIGGSDAGRFALTALSLSQEDGKPFLIVSQNDLFDGAYLTYVGGLYRQQAWLPNDAAANKASADYTSDLMQRFQHDQQFPNEPKQVLSGEEIRTVNGQIQISGQLPFLVITALLVRDILQNNPEREVYFEPYRLEEWMYAYLEPAGPVFKMRHAPADSLFEETVRNDREYWQRLTRRLIGVVVHDDMDLAEICASAQDLVGKPKDFQGDPEFLKDENARILFSKLRSAGGAVYARRMTHAKSTSEHREMEREAELAFRQAYLLCPLNTDVIVRYITFFTVAHRIEELEKFAAAAEKLLPRDKALYVQQMTDWGKTQK